MQRLKNDKALSDKLVELELEEPIVKPSDNRGGLIVEFISYLLSLILNRLKVGLTNLLATKFLGNTTDNIVTRLIRYASLTISAPGKKLLKIASRVQKMDSKLSENLCELVLDK